MKNLDMQIIYSKEENLIHAVPILSPNKDKNIEPVYFPPFTLANEEKIQGESYESIIKKMTWWVTDQAILLSSASNNEEIDIESSSCSPNYEKGIWRLFASNKCVEFVNDRNRLNLNYLSEHGIEKNGITIYATQYIDEYFCLSSEFFFISKQCAFRLFLVYISHVLKS
jgi:hypothetical protein